MKKNAFTLSEVLLTLSIIGIVAAITIPQLIETTGDIEIKAKWKKEFSALNQIIKQIEIENGSNINNLCSTHPNYNDNASNCISNLFKNNLNYQKYCASSTGNGICMSANVKNIDGSVNQPTTVSSFLLNDGTTLWMYKGTCGVTIYADLNGLKEPNRYGKDTFGVYVNNGITAPVGSSQVGCIESAAGANLSAKYLYE